MRNKSLLTTVVAVVVVLIAAGVLLAMRKSDNTTPTTTSDSSMSAMDMPKDSPSTSTSDTSSNSNTVTIKDFAYSPATLTVKVGTKVTWTNEDSVAHTVTADQPSSDAPASGNFGKGESYSFTFNKAGTYSYYCMPHPYMKATVVVTE